MTLQDAVYKVEQFLNVEQYQLSRTAHYKCTGERDLSLAGSLVTTRDHIMVTTHSCELTHRICNKVILIVF